MRITVVTPTIFRPSLKETVEALDNILTEGDEHLVIRDASRPPVDIPLIKALPQSRWALYFEGFFPESKYGNAQRDAGIQMARGDCIVFLDDDDLPEPQGYEVLHGLEYDPEVVHVFGMYREMDDKTFRAEVQEHGELGGPMVVLPKRDDLPRWYEVNQYSTDWAIFQKVKEMGLKIVCHDEIICRVPRANLGA